MYSTEITIKGNTIPLKFSFKTMEILETEMGFIMPEFQRNILRKQLSYFVASVVAAAKTASKNASVDVIKIEDVYDWVDEHGFLSKTVQDVYKIFIGQISDGLKGLELESNQTLIEKNVKAGKKQTPQL